MSNLRTRLIALLDSAEFARAFSLAVFATILSSFAIERMTGRVTYATIIAGLCVVGLAILVVRRKELSLLRLVPTTLLLFLAWALVSFFWSASKTGTLAGWISTAALTLLAIVVAHTRDTLQTVRSLGDTLRVVLTISFLVELLSGVLLDMPFTFLGVQGNLAVGGPIQGIYGTRNLLGLVTVIALITFVIEWRTQSIGRGLGIFSIALAGGLAVFSASPTVVVLALAVAVAAGALAVVRHAPPKRRPTVQWSIAGLVIVALGLGYLLRHRIIGWLDAGADFSTRSNLWRMLFDFAAYHPEQGWGWFGAWDVNTFPFTAINLAARDSHQSALNAFIDVLLQLGAIGLILFVLMVGAAMVRAWLVASERRSVLYTWTSLVFVALLVDSMFESFTLHGIGWFLLTLCAVKAGKTRSWRERLDQPRAEPSLPSA